MVPAAGSFMLFDIVRLVERAFQHSWFRGVPRIVATTSTSSSSSIQLPVLVPLLGRSMPQALLDIARVVAQISKSLVRWFSPTRVISCYMTDSADRG